MSGAAPSPKLSRRVQVRHSPIHGHGVFAVKALPAGSLIGPYTGRRHSAAEVAARDWDNTLTYVFGLSDGSVIDGAEGGNATRYINHSCAPNCVAYELEDEAGRLWIEVEALNRIEPGQELFIDYSLDTRDTGGGSYNCSCGAPQCRGTMAAELPP